MRSRKTQTLRALAKFALVAAVSAAAAALWTQARPVLNAPAAHFTNQAC